jgi:hypothetical protein
MSIDTRTIAIPPGMRPHLERLARETGMPLEELVAKIALDRILAEAEPDAFFQSPRRQRGLGLVRPLYGARRRRAAKTRRRADLTPYRPCTVNRASSTCGRAHSGASSAARV